VASAAPLVHPLIGSPDTGATSAPLLEPPGFLMLNYGRKLRSSASSLTLPMARSSAG
jgi:hypothetical protein